VPSKHTNSVPTCPQQTCSAKVLQASQNANTHIRFIHAPQSCGKTRPGPCQTPRPKGHIPESSPAPVPVVDDNMRPLRPARSRLLDFPGRPREGSHWFFMITTNEHDSDQCGVDTNDILATLPSPNPQQCPSTHNGCMANRSHT
jgi:hypothetical protein